LISQSRKLLKDETLLYHCKRRKSNTNTLQPKFPVADFFPLFDGSASTGSNEALHLNYINLIDS